MGFKQLMMTSEYDFLKNNERLGKRIILLGLGGSYAYRFMKLQNAIFQ